MSQDDVDAVLARIDALAEDDADPTSELLTLIDHASATVREAALWALWEGKLEQILEPLLRVAGKDPDESVRATALSVLGRFISEGLMLEPGQDDDTAATVKRVRTYLERVLNDAAGPEIMRRRALEALAFDADEALEEVIETWSRSENELLRKSAAFALGRADSDRLTKHLIKALDDPSSMVQLEAIRSVGDRGLKKALPKLVSLADGKDEELAREAIMALGQIGGPKAETALKSLKKKGGSRGEAARDALEEMAED